MTDLFRQTASALRAAFAAGDVSAAEIADAHIARLDAVNAPLNAIVQDGRDEARATATALDARRRQGDPLGPLAGIPVAIKVNADQAGFATDNGLRALKNTIATQDSPFVSHLRAADAVFLGRSNTPAFSLRWFTNNDLHGQTRNPHDPALTPGGSSGGAAAAVAAGLCPIAHGTDIAGSIRYPAYACGVHGLRPSLGRIPAFNASSGDRFIGGQLMAVSGPLARSIDDLALALRVMAQPDPRDPWQVPASPAPQAFARRAALCRAPDGMTVQPEVTHALSTAAKVLEDAGWTVEERDSPPLRPAARINAVLWMTETQHAQGALMETEGNADAQFVYAEMCRDIAPLDAETIMTALKDRVTLIRAWDLFLDQYPLVICPISGERPFAQQSDVRSSADFQRIYEAQLTQRALPVLGMPALAVATGFAGSAPLGVQLVAPRFREDILLAAGAQLEAALHRPQVVDPA